MKEGRGLEQKQIKSTQGTWLERLRSVRVAHMPHMASKGERGKRTLSSLCLILQPKGSQSSAERQGGREDNRKGQGQIHVSAVAFHSFQYHISL